MGGLAGCLACLMDRANIHPDELTAFRRLAQAYAQMNPSELARAVDAGDLLELSDDH